MAGVSAIGVGSNLDLASLLDDLQAAEQTKLTQISTQQASYKARISAYSQIQSALEAVQTAAAALGKAETISAVKGTVTGEAVTVTTEAGAIPGSYQISVEQLATAQRLQSAAFTDRAAQIGSGGTIEITLADGSTKTIELGGDTSLDGVVKAINGTDDAGVHATVVSDGSGNSYLMLTSKSEGEQAAVQGITVTGNDELGAVLSYDAASGGTFTVQQPAQDAKLTVNGIEVTSASNVVSGVIDNVTLTLSAVTPADGTPSTVTVSRDPSAASKAVQSFVTAYNALQTTIGNLTAFDVEKETQSALTGDSTTRSIQNSLAGALRITTSEGSLRTLSQLGITTNPTNGQLQLDQTALDEALAENPADVVRLLAGTGGLAESMQAATSAALGDNGTIKARTDGLQLTVDSLEARYERTEASIEATMEIYRQQFTQLDVLVAQMTQTSEYLTQQFANLSSSNNK
ncbi:flagellar filament capping protein FliD [Bordetella sp. 2513F-2]